jgi:hypothetical protein
VGFAITVLKRTTGALSEIAELYTRLGMDGGLPVHMLNPMPFYLQVYDESVTAQLLSKTEQALVWSRYIRLAQSPEFSRSTKHFWDKVFGENLPSPQPRRDARQATKTYRSCPWLDAGLYVNRHGQSTGCPRIKDADRHAFGNIGDNTRDDILSGREELARQVRGGAVPEPCAGCFIAESISHRLTNLMDKKPHKQALQGHRPVSGQTGNDQTIGSVPMDDCFTELLLPLCDGTRTSREIVGALARQLGTNRREARIGTLPVLNELIRSGTLAL